MNFFTMFSFKYKQHSTSAPKTVIKRKKRNNDDDLKTDIEISFMIFNEAVSCVHICQVSTLKMRDKFTYWGGAILQSGRWILGKWKISQLFLRESSDKLL